MKVLENDFYYGGGGKPNPKVTDRFSTMILL